MPATRGRRNPQLLEQRPEQQPIPDGFDRIFFCGRKTLTYLGDTYEPGARMPDSVGTKMPRLDTRIRQGLIHVQYVPRSGEAPPPPPPMPDRTLATALAKNVEDPPADCEHPKEHWQTVEIQEQLYELCSECGARRPVTPDGTTPAAPADGGEGDGGGGDPTS